MKRKHCSDEQFLEAVFTSTTYAQIADKTGQKESTCAARYLRIKKVLDVRGVKLPVMSRKTKSEEDETDKLITMVKQLKLKYGKD